MLFLIGKLFEKFHPSENEIPFNAICEYNLIGIITINFAFINTIKFFFFPYFSAIFLPSLIFWIFGSNKNNYSYLYNLNNKFSYLFNSSLFSISNTFTNTFTNLIDKEVKGGISNIDTILALKTVNSNKLFNLYTLNNGFNIITNFFSSNKFSLYSNFLNNNIAQQSSIDNKQQYKQSFDFFTNLTDTGNKNFIKTDLFNTINFINFKYYTYSIDSFFKVDNNKIKKLFFFK